MLRVFLDDDPGYLDWLAAYPDGFVLNMYRNPTPDYLVLHRPECEPISLYTQWRLPGGFTERQYRKVCGETRAALAGWVAQQGWPGAAWSEGCYCHSARQARA